MVSPRKPLVIGWKETVDLPEWNLFHILAKADTGARGSAIDVKRLEELPGGKIEFDVVLDRKDRSMTKRIVAKIWRKTQVKSSNGQAHERYLVKTRMLLGGIEKEIELSLVNRKSMVCRMLIGRTALENVFLVDASKKYLSRSRKKVKLME